MRKMMLSLLLLSLLMGSALAAPSPQQTLRQILAQSHYLQAGTVLELEYESESSGYHVKVLSAEKQIKSLWFTSTGQFVRSQVEPQALNTLLFRHGQILSLEKLLAQLPETQNLQKAELTWYQGQLVYQVQMQLERPVFWILDAQSGELLETRGDACCR